VRVTFGDVTLDPEAMQLERLGSIVGVEPQVLEVLCYLVEHRERLVPKTELLDEIWGDRFVSESALTSRIKSARRAIGDNGRDQRLIRTVHGRGFRFVADVAAAVASPAPSLGPVVEVGPGGHDELLGALVRDVLVALRAGRGLALAVAGRPAAARTEAVDGLLFALAAEGLIVGRGAATGLRSFGGVLDGLEAWVDRWPGLLDPLTSRCRGELIGLWAGEPPTSRQRLLVAVQELFVAAGAAGGAVLAVEDVHLADRSTLELLDLMARTAPRAGVALVVSHRVGFPLPGRFRTVRVGGEEEIAGAEVPPDLAPLLARVAVMGGPFDRSAFMVASGEDPAVAAHALEVALAEGLLEERPDGYRFRDLDVPAGDLPAGDVPAGDVPAGDVPAGGGAANLGDVLARSIAESARAEILRAVAARLELDGAAPERIAALLDATGDVQAAAPHHLAAATNAAWGELHAEVLRHTAGVDEVEDRVVRQALLELRADALAAGGEPEAIGRYREALRRADPERVPWLRARLGRAHLVAGDLDAAGEALDGVEPTGGPFDGGIMMVRGLMAYFQGDLELAERLAAAARELAFAPGAPPKMLDVIALQGLIAHSRGQWFDRLRRELRATVHSQELATTVFDSHVCVAQFLLYGPTGHDDVVRLAGELRESAHRMGSRQAVGFSTTLEGEAMLLSGDLDRAGDLLSTSVDIHRSIGADTGLAHALQRLAEVRLAEGDRAGAESLCRQALPLARWSPISRHLLQRIAGTLIAAAPDADAAAAAADEAFATLDDPAACLFCQVMLAVPAAMAYATVGRTDDARRQLDVAGRSARSWQGPAWPAAVAEAGAVLARAEGHHDEAEALFREAAAGFDAARQPLDAARCREAVEA
jgi:DNA-binding winged helix-turn-helix (wHTH) protein/tetratricopeptide (TPR) repeat protein